MELAVNKGFTLLEVMIAGALVAGLSIAVMNIVKMQQSSSIKITQTFEINQAMSEIGLYISNPYSCEKSFQDVELADFGETPGSMNRVIIKNKNGERNILKKGDKLSNKLSIENLYARQTANDPIEAQEQGIFELVVQFKKNGSAKTSNVISKVFKIVGTLDEDAKVIHCAASNLGLVLTARTQICTDLGNVFDEEHDPPCYSETGDGILLGGYP